ncbi:MAG: hypothetical protein AAGC60_28410 [Acidobacteriota bacterium]
MKTLLHPVTGWILVVGALASYLVLSVGLGIYQRIPWAHLLLGFMGVGILVFATIERPGILRIAGAALSTVLVAGFAWWTLEYSSYSSQRYGVVHAQETEADAGDEAVQEPLAVSIPRLASLELPNVEGASVPLLAPEARARATLIVLYRGYW